MICPYCHFFTFPGDISESEESTECKNCGCSVMLWEWLEDTGMDYGVPYEE